MGLREEIFSYLRGGVDPGQRVTDAQAAHARLVAERNAAESALATIATRRRELLIADASDDKINELEVEADRHRLQIERADLLEPEILNRLADARDARRCAEWEERHRLHHEAALEYAKALKAACDAFDRLFETANDARRAGFESEMNATTATVPRMAIREQAERFHFEVERLHDAELARRERRLAPPAPIAATTVVPPPPPQHVPVDPIAKPATPLPAAMPPAPAKPKRKAIREKAKPGENLFRVLRTGIELPDGRVGIVGDVVSLPLSVGESATRNGALDFADAPTSESEVE